MKKEFNIRSLAKALTRDILTAPRRVHDGFQKTFTTFFRSEPESRIDAFSNHTLAVANQGLSMGMSAMFGAIAGAKSPALMYAGFVAGAALLNPLSAKIVMKFFELNGRGTDKLLNAMGGTQRIVRLFPQFEAFPEFNKTLRTPTQ